MFELYKFLDLFLTIYMICIVGWALISWLPMVSPQLAYNETVAAIRRFLDSIVLPYIKLFRGIPPIRIGDMLLDLSAIVAIILLSVVRSWVLPTLFSAVI